MANIFSGLRQYAGKWAVSASRKFSDDEKNSVESNSIVESQFGLSVCFLMKNGGMTFIPLSSNSTKGRGESINLDTANLITLSKAGEADIVRVED